jgi:uncharacterized membrane protein YbaN (DUF454 family)
MRTIYFCCGLLSLGIGFIGVFLPVLPTTPFILLAVYFFSKSSERMHHWLVHHPRFGSLIRDWQEHRVIRPRAKWTASVMIAGVMALSIAFGGLPLVAKILLGATGAGVILLIRSYPSHPSA